MSKIRITSDLHLDFNEYTLDEVNILLKEALPEQDDEKQTDLVIAGDLFNPGNVHLHSVISSLTNRFKSVIFVLGNHDYWGGDLNNLALFEELQDKYHNLFILEDDTVRISDNVVVAGCTLWTDFNKGSEDVLDFAQYYMNDYRAMGNKVSPGDIYGKHIKSRHFLANLRKEGLINDDDKLIVVTHHAPSFNSIPEKFRGEEKGNFYYYSELDTLIDELKPDLWIHGHCHEAQDYSVGTTTRVINNPFGYPHEKDRNGYNSNLVLEV